MKEKACYMAEEKENIFQAAANKLRQPKTGTPPQKGNQAKTSLRWRDPELEQMMRRLKFMYANVQEAFSMLAKQMGMTSDQLHAWLEDENHLEPSQQALLKDLMTEFKSKLLVTSPEPTKKLQKADEEIARESKLRKGKTLGSRRNWIPMR